ncbi:MAG: bifunctional folylpolyglutamate synthase/dihydrofolate synthase [Elusimicrobia bacterium]|nr:bifunctional folylpolyglutamate synthase/dihydrofolate synthase [Candidatus Liberimonas magnetica]
MNTLNSELRTLNSELSLWQLNEYTEMKPGLLRIRDFLSRVGDPQKRFRSILITGTNGKGSTAKILSEILKASGYKTGLYTSPHLVDIAERIQINSENIIRRDLAFLSRKYLPLAKKLGLTFFEFITAIAFIYFAKKKIDIGILEIGLGGRFDAVNVIDDPELSIITDVDFDHCKVLGKTLSSIAFEKAGIIKNSGIVISGVEKEAPKKVIKRTAKDRKAEIFEFNKDFRMKLEKVDWEKRYQNFSYSGLEENYFLKLSLLGFYQLKNTSLALAASEILRNKGYSITYAAIEQALKNLKWPARFDVRRYKDKTIILDGSHNPGAVKKFLETFKKSPWGKIKRTFIFGMLKDKDYKSVIKSLIPYVKNVILVPVISKRRLSLRTMQENWLEFLPKKRVQSAESVIDGLEKAKKDRIVIVIGSLYLTGDILRKDGKYD